MRFTGTVMQELICVSWWSFVAVCLTVVPPLCPSVIVADEQQDAALEDDDEVQNGLLGEYVSGQSVIHRLDSRPAFDWHDQIPDVRLPAGPFSITWTGQLLIREPGNYVLHGQAAGSCRIEIDDQVVLNIESAATGFFSGDSLTLSPGEHDLRISYRSPNATNSLPSADDSLAARLQVFWSSENFTLEPLPTDVLFTESEMLPDVRRQARGEQLADAFRCAACHLMPNVLPTLSAPDLTRVAAGQHFATLAQRIRNPSQFMNNSRMPHFDVTEEQSQQLAAFLWSQSADVKLTNPGPLKSGDVSAGHALLLSRGCIACHQLPAQVDAPSTDSNVSGIDVTSIADVPHAAPSLQQVAQRRSAKWLSSWLKDPASLNPAHRMPVFDLSQDEIRQLVAALTEGQKPLTTAADVSPSEQQIAAGRQLAERLRCASCHQIAGLQQTPDFRDPQKSTFASGTEVLTARGCLREDQGTLAASRVPRFHVSARDRRDLAAWISSIPADAAYVRQPQRSAFARGEWLLQRHQCLQCHDRDQARGLSLSAGLIERAHEELRGRSQALVPPSLTAVGDKLTEDYLRLAVAGRQPARRLPWLEVRMPRFRHTDNDLADLTSFLTTRDRIPDAADAVRPVIAAAARAAVATPEELLLGNQLTGAAGFNCVACHLAGSFEPRNVAPGTRGSDLLTMGTRIRPRFFQRWMKNPIRVVAGIEMPAIKRAAPGILDDSLDQQMAVIWRAISDARFTAPTVVSRYEQFVNVEPGQPPRIIRDVFTIGENKDREGVARALAIGLPNGHNLLIDLDTLQLRQWTVGEFARQWTEGKSWFWSTAGIEVARLPLIDSPDEFLFQMLPSAVGGRTLPPVADEGRMVELVRYASNADSVDVWYRVHYPPQSGNRAVPPDRSLSGDPHHAVTAWNHPDFPVETVMIHERIQALQQPTGDVTGWTRSFTLDDGPANAMLVLRESAAELNGDLAAAEMQFQVSTTNDATNASNNASTDNVTDKAVGSVTGLMKGQSLVWSGTVAASIPRGVAPPIAPLTTTAEKVTSVPGFTGQRLPLDSNIMPTAITWLPDGRMALTSLKGHVWIASDTDNDGLEDELTLFEEGLAAPFGLLADGDSILVSHKPEILRLRDTDGDGRADQREVVASGWGLTDDYHDWTSGLTRDASQNLFVGIGSDYSQKNRPLDRDRWRGTVLKIDPSGIVTPLADGFRYPMGLALDQQNRLYATDNQGVQNTFNEINHIVPGAHFGVPSRHFSDDGIVHQTPALQIPHPWTRSVNSILFFPDHFAAPQLAGHGLGCEYDLRFLIRFTVQQVNGTIQGACYPFSRPNLPAGGQNFIGPICSAVHPNGDVYIGSIWDSGWQGGPNTGGITRLRPDPESRQNGIREVLATPTGFRIVFFEPVDRRTAEDLTSYSVQGYTREWGGSYATPDSHQHTCPISAVHVQQDLRSVDLTIDGLRPGYVYDLNLVGPLGQRHNFWPAEAHYSLKTVPE